MRLRFKTMLSIIFTLIMGCILMGVGYIFYDKVLPLGDSIVVVDGEITVNFLNGNEFSLNNDATLQFSVTNNGNEEAYYYIQFSDIRGKTSDITYEIKSSNNEVNVADNLKSEIISNNILIDGNKTDTYTVDFKTGNAENYSGKIVVGLKKNENNTFADAIKANNEIKENPLTSPGTNATEAEGLIKSKDDLGDAFYFRGAVTNNYVSFAGFTWRIVKINGDGSVKLVLNEVTDTLSKYYEFTDADFGNSIIKTSLNNWYKSNLSEYSDYIANYKYCNDLVFDEVSNKYVAYNRIATDKIPTYICLGTAGNEKIGLLTADEVMLAGASLEANNSYYLYNSKIETDYFTITSAKNDGVYYPFVVKADGNIASDVDGTLLRAVRPVISIIKTASVSGTGTIEDPYILAI